MKFDVAYYEIQKGGIPKKVKNICPFGHAKKLFFFANYNHKLLTTKPHYLAPI
jgi:hypothetical protein